MMIDVDSVVELKDIQKMPHMCPPSVVRDMAAALRVFAYNEEQRSLLTSEFCLSNKEPVTIEEYFDEQHGNHL